MSDARATTKGSHGGKRAGAGKPLGGFTGTTTTGHVKTDIVLKQINEQIDLPADIAEMSPLDILLFGMRYFAATGNWAAACSAAEKAARYMHAPRSPRTGNGPSTDEMETYSDQQLLTIVSKAA
jgi:hypothetical protein